jgi:hypothetical protein
MWADVNFLFIYTALKALFAPRQTNLTTRLLRNRSIKGKSPSGLTQDIIIALHCKKKNKNPRTYGFWVVFFFSKENNINRVRYIIV